MKTAANFHEKIAGAMGTIMMIAWVLVLGPVGALLLGGMAYATVAKNLVVGTLCVGLIFLPLVLTFAWGTVSLFATLFARREAKGFLITAQGAFDS